MNNFKIFIVEDDEMYGRILEKYLSLNPDYEVFWYKTGKDCLDNLYRKPAVITLDYTLPDIDGNIILREIKKNDPDLPVIIISGQKDISTAISLLKEGAYDYIVKSPESKEIIWNSLNNVRKNIELRDEVFALKEEVRRKYDFDKVIKGNSEQIKKVFSLMEKSAKTNIIVSITGETGTGKELVAKGIHHNSNRQNKAFVAINVAAIPLGLIESEMFGHEKGAFTGANSRKIGRFEQADKGTLFLDEIGEMDLNMQSKLLRVLQERELTRVGGDKLIPIDVRIIVATHKDLSIEVENGKFRKDLYYRLLGLPIELPPLRERGNDIIFLAKYFVDEFCKENKMPCLKISASAQEKLKMYHYPGNIRELRAILELAVVMVDGDTIGPDDFSFNINGSANNFLHKEQTLQEYNFQIINHFLKKYDDNVRLVANKLGIGKTTIYRMLKDQKIQ